jgi:hypothetical protein
MAWIGTVARARVLAWIGFAAIAGLTSASARAGERDAPTVVELFQSQGCSDCPPANANVIALSDRPDILALSFGVTYWDKLGWKDTFASPQFTSRQWDYAHAFHREEVFTPEVVVNGRADVVGRDRRELEEVIRRNARAPFAASIVLSNGTVSIGAAAAVTHSADIWLVRYDPNVVQVAIQRGENEGRTLPHKNVVKELLKLGDWTGQAETFTLPAPHQGGLRQAVLLQEGPGGPIVAAARG